MTEPAIYFKLILEHLTDTGYSSLRRTKTRRRFVMKNKISKRRPYSAQAMVEYVLLIELIALVSLVGIKTLGNKARNSFATAALSMAAPENTGSGASNAIVVPPQRLNPLNFLSDKPLNPNNVNSSGRGDAVAEYALKQIGSYKDGNWCLRAVNDAFQSAGGARLSYNSAKDAYNAQRAQGNVNTFDPSDPPPKGAAIFWPPTKANGYNGHVAVSLGDGRVMSSGWDGQPSAVWDIGKLNKMEGGVAPNGWIPPPQ